MFKNAFLSEYSFGNESNHEKILKINLLSNEKIVLPAATIMKTDMGNIISNNLDTLDKGAISIAHGSDCDSLTGYINKYPNNNWDSSVVDLFNHFDKEKLHSVYKVEKTQARFNTLMRQCAVDNTGIFSNIFSNNNLCNEILNYEGLFNLTAYLIMIDKNISNEKEKKQLKAHAMYFYNYFGATSTGSGNTFSLENTTNFNYISKGYDTKEDVSSGINILISSALDFTEGTEDFNDISILQGNFINKLSYKDILEIRQNWLHSEVINKYEQVVEECASAYLDANNENFKSSIEHIEHAFELKQEILTKVRAKLKHEIITYNLTGLLRVFSNTPIIKGIIDFPDTIDDIHSTYKSAKNALKLTMQGTTQITSLTGNQLAIKKMIDSKTQKMRDTKDVAATRLGAKSPVLMYLKLLSKKVEKNLKEDFIRGI